MLFRSVNLPDSLGSIKCYGVPQKDVTARSPSNTGGSIVFFLEWNMRRNPHKLRGYLCSHPPDQDFINEWKAQAKCASLNVVEATDGVPGPFDPA